MTVLQRFSQLLIAIAMIGFSMLLLMKDQKAYPVIITMCSLALIIYGLQMLWYFWNMARFMVGGWSIFFRGILALDFGLFTGSLVTVPHIYILIYLSGTMAFSGIIGMLRARESWKIQGPWRLKALQGLVEIIIALACFFFMRSPRLVVDIFASGLIFSAFMRIINAFRRTPVVTID